MRNRAGRVGAELLIVVLGVLLALAADGWRETAAERRVEAEYLDRLYQDLSVTLTALDETQERFARVLVAAKRLSSLIDEGGRDEDDSVLGLVLEATAAGFPRSALGLDGTYRELQVSGRLALLHDSQLRRRLVEFYMEVDNTFESMTDVTTMAATYRVTRAISSFPGLIEVADLTAPERERLLGEIRQNPAFGDELRHLIAKLGINTGRFSELRRAAEGLALMLESAGAGAA